KKLTKTPAWNEANCQSISPLRKSALNSDSRLPASRSIGFLVENHEAHALGARSHVGGQGPGLDAAAGDGADHVDRPCHVRAKAVAGQLVERDGGFDLPGVVGAVDGHEPARVPSQVAPAVVADA